VKTKRIVPPEFIRALIFFMASGMFFLGITKVLFYLVNRHTFQNVGMFDVLAALWVDAITVALTFSPFAVLWLLPFSRRRNPIYKNFFRVFFLLTIAFLSASNLLDVIYYGFSGKRSTFDLFSVLGHEKEMGNHWVTYIKDFWWLALLLFVFVYLGNVVFNRIYHLLIPEKSRVRPLPYLLSVSLSIGLLVIVARGGFGLRPFGLISISKITAPDQVGFVSNTAFAMIKTFENPGLERLKLLDEKRENAYYSPFSQYNEKPFEHLPEKTNVVVLILESFGNEWLGTSIENESYTPFFDSLCSEGIFFPNGYANGTKSVEAMPAVLASMPSLMETPYITSQYASNKIDGVGFLLKKLGYSSAFFHGAAKGSMNFDGFAALIGMESYFGKESYPYQNDFDGTWGIFDHKFLPWCAKKISDMKQPFFTSIFTISSHHPYVIPKELKGKLKKGPYPICESLNLADHALRLFFEEAKMKNWYKNTLFVFVADHTSSSQSAYYGKRSGKFSIPILYFMPNNLLPREFNEGITQQIDILPSILHFIGYQDPIYSFGQSVFKKERKPFAINYLEGVYHLFFDNYLMTFSAFQKFELFDIKNDPNLTNDLFEEKQQNIKTMCLFLQAFIQRYNNDLIDNKNHASKN
jgi:phosphoglycerol transferase MdoB-like AlkP superfamily enzyme